MPGSLLNPVHVLILMTTLWGRSRYPLHSAEEETESQGLPKALGLIMGFLITFGSKLVSISTKFMFVFFNLHTMTMVPSGPESWPTYLLCLCILTREEDNLCFSSLKINIKSKTKACQHSLLNVSRLRSLLMNFSEFPWTIRHAIVSCLDGCIATSLVSLLSHLSPSVHPSHSSLSEPSVNQRLTSSH